MLTSEARGSFLEGEDLLLQSGELQHSQGVVLHQEATQCVPAAANTHHHVFVMEHPDKERLVSQSVAPLRQVLNGDSVGAVAGRVVHALLPGLVEATVLAAHAEGFDGWRWFLCHQQSLLQLNLLLQLHQNRRLHAVLRDDAADLQQAEANLPRFLMQHETL